MIFGHHKDRRGHGHAPDHTPDTSYIHNPDVAHEASDVNVRGIINFIIALTVSTAVALLIVWGLFAFLARRSERSEPPPSPLALRGEERLPPEPRLQLAPGHEAHPLQDMKQLQAEWQRQLGGYGWTDQTTGAVHIPIEHAKQLMLERNMFPSRPEAPPEIANEQIPSYQSSGRQPERRLQ